MPTIARATLRNMVTVPLGKSSAGGVGFGLLRIVPTVVSCGLASPTAAAPLEAAWYVAAKGALILMYLARPAMAAITVVTLAMLSAKPAAAELGRSLASVNVDRQRMGARLTSTAMGHYARHELTRTNGGSVREFTNASGQVFAVTWSGPGKPDLQALLGDYFTAFQNGNAAAGRGMHALRRPTQVSATDLQIQSAGHMGWFHGVAYVPSLAPADFDPTALAPQS